MFRELCNQLCIRIRKEIQNVMGQVAGVAAQRAGLKVVDADAVLLPKDVNSGDFRIITPERIVIDNNLLWRFKSAEIASIPPTIHFIVEGFKPGPVAFGGCGQLYVVITPAEYREQHLSHVSVRTVQTYLNTLVDAKLLLTEVFTLEKRQIRGYRPNYANLGEGLYLHFPNEAIETIPHIQIGTSPTRIQRIPIPGLIYLIYNGSEYKIGLSTNLQKRMKALQTQSPSKLQIVHTIPTDDTFRAERELHNRYADKRLNGEWFDLTSDEVASIQQIKHITYGELLQ